MKSAWYRKAWLARFEGVRENAERRWRGQTYAPWSTLKATMPVETKC